MLLMEAINNWKEIHPSYYEVAGDHRLGCSCPDCICFADDAAAESDDPDSWLTFITDVELEFSPIDSVQPYIPEERREEYLNLTLDL